MSRVLVTGATGNVGRHVVAALQERGATVRAFVRDADRAAGVLGGDIELAVGDFADPVSLRRAMQGVDRMFLACANGPRQVAQENAAINAASVAWLERIVKLSWVGAEVGSPLMFSDTHARIEQHLRAVPVPSVVLNASFLMTNLLASAPSIRDAGQLVAPAGEAKISMIDPRDVAAVATTVLLGGDHIGKAYLLTGPQVMTYADAATELSAALERPVGFVDVPDQALHTGLRDSGAPDWLADGMTMFFRQLRDGVAAPVTDTVRVLTGREPYTLATFARDHRSMFLGGQG